MHELSLEIEPGEYWYGPLANDGFLMPFTVGGGYHCNIEPNTSSNQAAPLLLSSRGRFLWCDSGFSLATEGETIRVSSRKAAPVLSGGHENLRGALLAAQAAHFPPSGICPPELFFTSPQYNTWIELLYDQNEADVMRYARAVIENGYAPGILMIDDNWMEDYGVWRFDPIKFPNPDAMTRQLHEMGFKVMLWTCPFISPDSAVFRELKTAGLLLRDSGGSIVVREWWNGYSAVLDLSNPAAAEWYHRQNRFLMDQYEIDGFKFDAGDAKYYRDDDRSHTPCDANGHTELWARIGLAYPYNEYRACFKMGGQALVQRLADKNHRWDRHGMAALIPNTIMHGLLGYPFSCPDMIGGGQCADFQNNSVTLDEELFVRYAQCAALTPMMQFSAAPWRVLSRENADLCRRAADIRSRFSAYIANLAKHAARSGEPMARCMEYEFPGQGMEPVRDQFMLGSDILAAPVCEKGAVSRQVLLPKGRWTYSDGREYSGGGAVEVKAPLETLPFFTRAG
ncbi:glycoside hydrolase [Spirochaetia bacterium]|nr:glycoside hydrolase [Spirochaetia bacterium]